MPGGFFIWARLSRKASVKLIVVRGSSTCGIEISFPARLESIPLLSCNGTRQVGPLRFSKPSDGPAFALYARISARPLRSCPGKKEQNMNQSLQPLIAGAGPVGLAAALFLTRNGQTLRVIEQQHEPSRQSKALAVNPRTLDLLWPTGVTEQMLEIGLPVHGVRFYRNDRNVASLSLAGIHPKYPYLLALSQATTERLLAEALQAAGGKVERGMKLVKCRGTATGVEAEIEATNGGASETIECPWLLAAEGAHSVAREQLGIEFSGSAFLEDWHLVDVPLRTSLAQDLGHVFFLSDGALLFMFRVIDDTLKDRGGEPIWRIIANRPNPLSQLRQAEQTEPPLWESKFRISHRINATMASNSVYFAGDSAHIHSPIGARGMNLGIEDAWVCGVGPSGQALGI